MSKDNDEFEFSSKLKTQPVKIDGKKHTVKELTGEQRDDHGDYVRTTNMNVEGSIIKGIKTMKGLQSKLLSLCLYDENGELVPQDVIEKYPAKMQGALHKLAQKLSGLEVDEKANELASKND